MHFSWVMVAVATAAGRDINVGRQRATRVMRTDAAATLPKPLPRPSIPTSISLHCMAALPGLVGSSLLYKKGEGKGDLRDGMWKSSQVKCGNGWRYICFPKMT